MPNTYQLPGVYVEETPGVPAVIISVETGIPVFVGYTEKAFRQADGDLYQKPFRIEHFLDYAAHFGEAFPQEIKITLSKNYQPLDAAIGIPTKYLMYYAVKSFYDNGGGACYILSLGSYREVTTANISRYDDSGESSALNQLISIEEIDLLIFPDLASLGEEDYYEVSKKALTHCARMRNRFLIMDVFSKNGNDKTDNNGSIASFSHHMVASAVQYGAAYYPYLKSAYTYNFFKCDIHLTQENGVLDGLNVRSCLMLIKADALQHTLNKCLNTLNKKNKSQRLKIIQDSLTEMLQYVEKETKQALLEAITAVRQCLLSEATAVDETTRSSIEKSVHLLLETANETMKNGSRNQKIMENNFEANLKVLKNIFTGAFQKKLTGALSGLYVTIPAAGAVAGVYAKNDRERGVWKSPANMPLDVVIEPVVLIDDRLQTDLNLSDDGISINSIRSFPAKGVLVWGARTLDGNNTEWRYVAVRRFMSMVEKTVVESLKPFTLEENNVTSWINIRNMVNNFLLFLWRAGALQGVKAEDAFFVKVGLNETMTQQDIFEGRLIVQIGMAVVKPAEFIIIRICQLVS